MLALIALLAPAVGAIEADDSQQSQATPFIAAHLCQPLAPASGMTVSVDTVAELENAVNTAVSGQTILIADGVYNLNGVYLRIAVPNVTLRAASGNREAVVLDGNYITTEIIQISQIKKIPLAFLCETL